MNSNMWGVLQEWEKRSDRSGADQSPSPEYEHEQVWGV